MTVATSSGTAPGAPLTGPPVPRTAITGLTDEQAAHVLAEVGPNDPVTAVKRSLLRQVAARFKNPLVIVLLVASGISAAFGDVTNAVIVLVIVLLSASVEFVQTRRADRAAAALAARVAHTAQVLRSGHWTELASRLVVPGDILRLDAGNLVPADARLLEAHDLHLNEASLTGESLPTRKEIGEEALMGAAVVSGSATARVLRTGTRTAFGDIAKALAERPPVSEFERGVFRYGMFILKTVVALILFVFLANAAMHRDPLQSFLFGVALAVGLTPEFLPMITTVTLTKGAERMARENVIVKNLAAIQNLGSMDVLCTDKTGTLTTGEMKLEHCVDPFGEASDRPHVLACVNSYFESGVDNPMDAAVLQKARLDPLDSAVLQHPHPDISGYVKLDEVPFDFERRRVSVVAKREGAVLLVTKGAPESVLGVSTQYEAAGQTLALDDETRRRCTQTFERLGADGYRVLGVAFRKLEGSESVDARNETALIFLGFLAFADPPREDAADVLSKLALAGVRVVILTGDSDLVARHVADRVGLKGTEVLLGRDLDKTSDPALAYAAERVGVFARVTPRQKTRILLALRGRGHVVGFLGDGINDAPSLRMADVGVSVSTAADVAKDAADVILLDPSLKAVLAGIVEGRKAFGNVMKYLLMGTSSNFGNVFSMALASAVLPFLPMLPTQILLNNFLYDVAQLTIPSDAVDAEMTQKPRRWDIASIRRVMLWIGPVSSAFDVLTFWVLIGPFQASAAFFHTGWFVESLVTQALVIFVIRTAKSPFSSRPSNALVLAVLGVVAAAVLVAYSPAARLLGFVPLPWTFFLFLVPATLAYLAVVETLKRKVLKKVFA